MTQLCCCSQNLEVHSYCFFGDGVHILDRGKVEGVKKAWPGPILQVLRRSSS